MGSPDRGAVMEGSQSPDATVLALQGEPGSRPITAACRPGEPGLYLTLSDFLALPENQVRELWLFTGKTPASALCAKPTENGLVFEFVDASLEAIGLTAVTVESSECPDAPTTTPIFIGEVRVSWTRTLHSPLAGGCRRTSTRGRQGPPRRSRSQSWPPRGC